MVRFQSEYRTTLCRHSDLGAMYYEVGMTASGSFVRSKSRLIWRRRALLIVVTILCARSANGARNMNTERHYEYRTLVQWHGL
jgi:hypothetical protein